MRKSLIAVGLFLALASQSFAGVAFVAKSTWKAAKFVTYPSYHPVKDAHAAGKTVKFAAKSVYAVGKFGANVVK